MLSLFGMVSRMKVCLTCIKGLDVFKVFVCFVPFENHHLGDHVFTFSKHLDSKSKRHNVKCSTVDEIFFSNIFSHI